MAPPVHSKVGHAIPMASPYDPADPFHIKDYTPPLPTTTERLHLQVPVHITQKAFVRAQERAAQIPEPYHSEHAPARPLWSSFTSTADQRLVQSRQFTAVSARQVVDVDTALQQTATPSASTSARTQRTLISQATRTHRHVAPMRGEYSDNAWAPVPQGPR